jgi:hypothetical protein
LGARGHTCVVGASVCPLHRPAALYPPPQSPTHAVLLRAVSTAWLELAVSCAFSAALDGMDSRSLAARGPARDAASAGGAPAVAPPSQALPHAPALPALPAVQSSDPTAFLNALLAELPDARPAADGGMDAALLAVDLTGLAQSSRASRSRNAVRVRVLRPTLVPKLMWPARSRRASLLAASCACA